MGKVINYDKKMMELIKKSEKMKLTPAEENQITKFIQWSNNAERKYIESLGFDFECELAINEDWDLTEEEINKVQKIYCTTKPKDKE